MNITYLGHACFEFLSRSGVIVVADPYDFKIGYKDRSIDANIVTIRHNHYDHNNLEMIHGEYKIINSIGTHNINGIKIDGIHSYHDESNGLLRGENIIFKYLIDDNIICHLGDLGHELSENHLEKIGQVDILLVPVGGIYTINLNIAKNVVTKINPKIIIPMHYKTDKLLFDLDTVDNFLYEYENVNYVDTNTIIINDAIFEKSPKVIVMNFE